MPALLSVALFEGAPLVSHYDEAFIDSGGRLLPVRSWMPRNLRATLVLVPELNMHGRYYDRLVTALAKHGIASHTIDLQQSAEPIEAIEAFIRAQRLREPALPLFLLGHGAGGLTAGLYARAHPRELTGLICESVALDLAASAVALSMVRCLAAITPQLPVLRLPIAKLTRDSTAMERMSSDPDIHEWLRARQVAAMIHAGTLFRASLPDLLLPLLVLHGSADRVTLPSGSECLHQHAGSHDKTLQIFEGYYHDLINDQGHEHVVTRIRQWIEARLNPDHRGQIGIAYINTDS